MLTLAVLPQSDFKLTKDQNGIKVYTASNDSSSFKSVKVEAIFDGTLQNLVAILMDVGNNKQWVYKTKQSHLIRRNTPNELVYYAETSLPWPLSNRDIVIKMNFDLDTINNTLKVLQTGMPDSIPSKKGIVRVRTFNASWDVKSVGANKVSINYFLSINPGGSIPAGISNMFVSKGPFETFNNLSKLLKKQNHVSR
jgi:hypothetical protein